MHRFPYPNFPFSFYRGFPRNIPPNYNFSSCTSNLTNSSAPSNFPPAERNFSTVSSNIAFTEGTSKKSENNRNLETKNKSNNNNDDFLFDLFGLKIYFDDVLLVSLIYFLYSEGVKDESLFIVLLLLLIS